MHRVIEERRCHSFSPAENFNLLLHFSRHTEAPFLSLLTLLVPFFFLENWLLFGAFIFVFRTTLRQKKDKPHWWWVHNSSVFNPRSTSIFLQIICNGTKCSPELAASACSTYLGQLTVVQARWPLILFLPATVSTEPRLPGTGSGNLMTLPVFSVCQLLPGWVPSIWNLWKNEWNIL